MGNRDASTKFMLLSLMTCTTQARTVAFVTGLVEACVMHPEWAVAWLRQFEQDGMPTDDGLVSDLLRALPIEVVTSRG